MAGKVMENWKLKNAELQWRSNIKSGEAMETGFESGEPIEIGEWRKNNQILLVLEKVGNQDEAMEDESFEAMQNVFSSDSTHKNNDDVAARDKVVDEPSVNLPIYMNDMYSLLEMPRMNCKDRGKDSKGVLCVENGPEKINTQNGLDEESLESLYVTNEPIEKINPRFDGDTLQDCEKAQFIENHVKMDNKEDSCEGQKGTLSRDLSFKSDGEVERDQEKSLWEGLESDSERLEEWMERRKRCSLKKRKARKAQSCASMYRSALIIF
ncbi:hypothetical protein SLEP1_g32222 [Rubroshorea leprosula]|uniref:Uncharacterized protein n=1 Tax=Rubroshorea leprosula TaxID=152421 RepID=A0AAV5KCK6_9ROSI|nr:hypothetical protein SLEP1_g32222 [Rubroshorea leprosula]